VEVLHNPPPHTVVKRRVGTAASTCRRTKRLRALEEENARLKKLLADAMLDNAMLKEIASKKW
jgi:hypothetical protein